MHFYVSHRPSIQHGRSTALASSLVALPASLGLLRPVSATGGGLRAPLRFGLRGVPCLRTSCARHFSPSGLHLFASICSAKNARNDVHPTIRNGRPAAPEGLQYSLVHWAYYGLFRALRAAFVRPVISDESLALPILCQCSVAHALPWEWACAYMSAPDEGHIRVWEQAAAVAGGMGHLGPTPAPAAFYAALPAFATASGALFRAAGILRHRPIPGKLFDAIHAPFGA